MNGNFEKIREKIYDLEMMYGEIGMLIEIIKDFGEYNDEVLEGTEKMHYIAAVLAEKSFEYKKCLAEFIPEFQKMCKSCNGAESGLR